MIGESVPSEQTSTRGVERPPRNPIEHSPNFICKELFHLNVDKCFSSCKWLSWLSVNWAPSLYGYAIPASAGASSFLRHKGGSGYPTQGGEVACPKPAAREALPRTDLRRSRQGLRLPGAPRKDPGERHYGVGERQKGDCADE